MINMSSQSLTIGSKTESIIRWEVWFQTFFGLASTFEEALKVTLEADLDPNAMIVPVVVAVGDTLYEPRRT